MITDAKGNPLSTEPRSIKILETTHEGKATWAVDFKPSVAAFEFEEVIQVLGQTIMGLAQNTRARKHEAMAMHAVKEKLQEMNK